MSSLWPWLALAGLGALHGLSPATGWMFAAARGVRAREAGQRVQAAQVRWALLPIAVGHAASVGIVAVALAQGMALDRTSAQGLAGALLVGAALWRWWRGSCGAGRDTLLGRQVAAKAGDAGIALWSFLMATAHGAGMMLVPALVPLCLADNPARAITASGSMGLALAAVGVHTAAMLVTTGLVATGICRGLAMQPRLLGGPLPRRAWTVVLAVTGLVLLAQAG